MTGSRDVKSSLRQFQSASVKDPELLSMPPATGSILHECQTPTIKESGHSTQLGLKGQAESSTPKPADVKPTASKVETDKNCDPEQMN